MRKSKKTYFVCAAILNNKLEFLTSESLTRLDAIYDFKKQFGVEPDDISGPFFAKREHSNRKLRGIKFSTISYSAIYDGYNIIVNELVEPRNYVWATFNSTIDGNMENIPEPKILPI